MRPLLLALLTLIATSCGEAKSTPSAEDALAEAQRSLETRTSGRLEFALHASVEDSGPVGFEIEGPYAFDRTEDLAVLDLTYRLLLGEDTQETGIVSDGGDAWVITDGEATQLTAQQARTLRLGKSDEHGAVPALELVAWIERGEVEMENSTTTITGGVKASELIEDLQVVAGQVMTSETTEMDADAKQQIDAAVEDSEMRVTTAGGTLRTVSATIDFGADVPRALRDALGSYAGAHLELSMKVDDIKTPLRVDPPS